VEEAQGQRSLKIAVVKMGEEGRLLTNSGCSVASINCETSASTVA
jgi:hypothetical protein